DVARQAWLDAALEVMNEQVDHERLGRIRAEAAVKLDATREQINALNDELRIDVDDFDLPDIEVPEADPSLGMTSDEPLLDSSWTFVEQTRRLRDSKAYRDYGGGSSPPPPRTRRARLREAWLAGVPVPPGPQTPRHVAWLQRRHD